MITKEAADPSDPRMQHGYAFFLLHLEQIELWIGGGCPVKVVWRFLRHGAAPRFPGSYHSFLRYCRTHGLRARRMGEESATRANTALSKTALNPSGTEPSLRLAKRYPPPLEKPPGWTPPFVSR